jgi:hypothetical protein
MTGPNAEASNAPRDALQVEKGRLTEGIAVYDD